MVVLVTEGDPTTGITDPDRILTNVRQANGARVSIHVLAVGVDVDFRFLQTLAQQNRGTARRAPRARDIHARLTHFYSELASPLMKNVRMRYEDSVDDATLTDVHFPAYFDGGELVVAGRVKSRVGHLTPQVWWDVRAPTTSASRCVQNRVCPAESGAILYKLTG